MALAQRTHNAVEVKFRDSATDTMSRLLFVWPIAITLYIIGFVGLFTIIFIPGSALLFMIATAMLTGRYVITCPSCSKKFSVMGGADSKECPHCKTPTVINWLRKSA